MKKLLFFGCLLLTMPAIGQTQLPSALGNVYYDVDLYRREYNSPEGSPYLNEEFTPAKINQIKETKLVRFDALKGKIEVMVTDKKVVVLNESTPYTVTLLNGTNKVYETHKFTDEKGSPQTSFFEVIGTEEGAQLYFREKVKFMEAKKAQVYSAGEPARFVRLKGSFYAKGFKNTSDTLISVPRKTKSFLAFFPNHQKELKTFLKKEKLKLDKGEDLLKIFQYYKSLP